jgi:hypothetical protein
MGERSQGLGFALETLAGQGALAVQHLQGYRLPVHPIATAEYHAHAPAADQRLDLEAPAETPMLARQVRRLFSGWVQALVHHGGRTGITMKRRPNAGSSR